MGHPGDIALHCMSDRCAAVSSLKLKVRLKILGDSTPIFDTFRQNEYKPDSDPRY